MDKPLNAETWSRLSALFDLATEQSAPERSRWLQQIERDEPSLAPQLRDLLAADAERRADDWLERGPSLHGASIPEDDDGARGFIAGAQVGPWRLVARLGSGGMATVWRAVRADALPAREIALKLPLTTLAASQLPQRFAREQAILARLEHPHIARLYDAGVTAEGTPWIAMECVEGEPIDAWCDAHRLGVAARLALFAQVLDAVQYAHARLVIHRDLKPSNILVTGDAQVRLLDFGIARLVGDETGAAAAQTQAAAKVMTLSYAAPEQVLGQPLTTAVDVYALGVVLFRLLVGHAPYRPKFETAAQLEQAVADADVRRASDLADAPAAQARGCRPAALRSALAGDLDTILGKALARDPARRYASAAALADDLARHLDGRPVAARPDTAFYRLRKIAGRHRLSATAAAAVLLSLAVGTGLALWQGGIARQERNSARAEAERSNAINFFYADLLEQAARADKPLAGRALVERAEVLARREFADHPDALASVFLSIGQLHAGQGRLHEGRAILEEALGVVRDPVFKEDIVCNLAVMLDDRQRAIGLLNEVLAPAPGAAHSRAGCLVYRGDLLRADDPAAAERSYRQALADWSASPSHSPHDEVTIRGRLAFVAALLGRTAEAVQGYRQALARADALGRDGAAMGTALRRRLARTWLIAGAPQQALPLYEQLVAEAVGSAASAAPAELLIGQAQALLDLGRAADALPVLQAAAASARATDHAGRQWQTHCLQRWAAAQAGAAVAPALLAASAPAVLDEALTRATCALAEAQVLRAAGRWTALTAHLDAVLATQLPEPQWTVDALLLRAEALWHTGQGSRAAADAKRALEAARRLRVGSDETPRAAAALAWLARSPP